MCKAPIRLPRYAQPNWTSLIHNRPMLEILLDHHCCVLEPLSFETKQWSVGGTLFLYG